jgi:hypothetical protein
MTSSLDPKETNQITTHNEGFKSIADLQAALPSKSSFSSAACAIDWMVVYRTSETTCICFEAE